jgi:hypothetical protein
MKKVLRTIGWMAVAIGLFVASVQMTHVETTVQVEQTGPTRAEERPTPTPTPVAPNGCQHTHCGV